MDARLRVRNGGVRNGGVRNGGVRNGGGADARYTLCAPPGCGPNSR